MSSTGPRQEAAEDGVANRLLETLSTVRWNRFHTVAVLLFGLGWALDAFEVTLIGNVLGALRQHFGLGSNAMSVILAAWFVGLMIGAAGFGALSDRFGRRRVFLASLVLYGVATLATAFAPNLATLLVLRLLGGIGVGAEYSAINAAIAELVPSRSRGRAAAIVLNFWPLGSFIAALLAWLVLSSLPPDLGWRVVFGLGGVVALSAAWFRRHLPESPRWLIDANRAEDARAIVAGIEAGLTTLPPASAVPVAHRIRREAGQFGRLVRQYPGRLLLGAALDFAEAAGYYGLFAFLPIVVLPALHLPADRLPLFYLAGSVGAAVGGLAAASLLDRIGRSWTVGGFYLATALGLMLFALVTGLGAGPIMLGFALVNLLATGSWIAAYPTFSELFPTALRATGIGASVAVGRVGAALSPFLVGYVGSRSMPAALIMLAGFWALGAVAILIWRLRGGIEARGLALEQLSAAPARGV
ncbi:MAG TPA: MFS transporter [Acidiphilium sp.]|jgi:MFS family permease|uniref:MFS transporter n=1 Tax=unclassified Acidiphilium TaxID=2617493 RepID=UPI000BC803FC|nr:MULTISPECIES: MFS transporter [unclassified Acidiphilium]OYV57400.1 MAG: MFS transporter [Acidiphilium sp. 20-67-58]HQT59741.1 MFS transporter [Acidiphilium sp.]HQU10780.1 MFS transporter [Acidiphilium sp.]